MAANMPMHRRQRRKMRPLATIPEDSELIVQDGDESIIMIKIKRDNTKLNMDQKMIPAQTNGQLLKRCNRIRDDVAHTLHDEEILPPPKSHHRSFSIWNCFLPSERL